MLSRIRRVLDDHNARLSRIQNEASERRTSGSEENREPVVVPMADGAETEPKNQDFEPIEKQRHFGILHYTMTKRFRKIMCIGLINVILILSCSLFIFLFVELHKSTPPVTPSPTSTRKPTTPSEAGYCRGSLNKVGNDKCWKLDTTGWHINSDTKAKCFSQAERIVLAGITIYVPPCSCIDHIQSERSCTSGGGWLSTAHNEEEHQEMVTYIGKNNAAIEVWMGMYCTGNNITDCMWDDAKPLDPAFNNFAPGHPDVTIGACVKIRRADWKWYSTACSDCHSKMCEVSRSHGGSFGCAAIVGSFCYLIFPAQPFAKAARQCQLWCGSFASIHSTEENQWIRTLFSLRNDQFYTIGGYAFSKDSFYWVDGTEPDFNNIESFNGEGCLYMSYSLSSTKRGNWFTDSCEKNATFVCKKPLGLDCKSVTQTTTTVSQPTVSPDTCGSVFLQESGYFTSPNFPHAYPSNIKCTWTLLTYGPQRLSLVIRAISIGTDSITIYDGDSEKGNYQHTLTGSNGFSGYSEGNVFFVKFEAGSNRDGHSGFNATFETIY